jgi:imidazole glycerol-phosphate synthase subunit HisH
MISIIDYGLGNIRAFENIYRRLGVPVQVVKTAAELQAATKIILPGVGAFDWAIECLNKSGMTKTLNDLVLEKKVPVLGVCVGMQIMAKSSEEGELAGLGWIDAEVKRFDESKFMQHAVLPHMGWNQVATHNDCRLFSGINNLDYYFLHSYYLMPSGAVKIVGTSNYNISFASAIEADNILATQFHPEKSLKAGSKLLKNFAELY